MTYLKTLIALTTLALLTACAGGVAITNNTTIIPPAATCTANPFTTGCTTTLAEQATFCRDTSKTTDTKTADCADTVIRLCGENPFETGLCTTPTPEQTEVFCRDTTKTPDGKATNCAQTVSRVCDDNPYDAGLCLDNNTYDGPRARIALTCTSEDDDARDALCPTAVAPICTDNPFNAVCRLGDAGAGAYNTARLTAIADCGDATKRDTIAVQICADATTQACGENPYNAGLCYDGMTYNIARDRIRLTCTNNDDDLRDALCPTAVASECMADPFLDVCRLGTAGASDGTYGLERAAQILATCAGENGEGFGNVFDPKCSDVEPYQTEKDRITNECEGGGGNTETCPANVVMQVCLGNPYNTVLCFEQGGTDYSTQRMERLEECKGNNGLDGCVAAAATTCPENPFQAGICFIDDTTYATGRETQTETCRGTPNGANCGSARALGCDTSATGVDSGLFTDMLCSSHMDYHGDRERICLTNKTAPNCMLTVTRVCDLNNFDPLCDESTTYQDLREGQCTDPNTLQCTQTTARICGADKFDAYCTGATLVMDTQIDECADATATNEQCNMVFAGAFAGCLADPFSVACDTEPTFADDKVAVRTSRYNFCKALQTTNNRCTGYVTCNTSATFAPLTCGADFQPARVAFCMTTANAFDPLCVDNGLIDAAAQLAYCKLPSTDAFDVNGVCDGSEFKQARVDFCIATPATKVCNDDVRGEGLMKEPVPTDPCADGACVEVADLPATILTTPTVKFEQDGTTETADFADGFLNVTLNTLAEGTSLLNPDGTENTTIDTTNFLANVRLVADSLEFGRRGGRGSSDADGFVWFSIYKGATGTEESQTSRHAAILPTTNLGAPLTEAPATAVWPGHFYRDKNRIDAADFYVTFESLPSNQIGRIGFANPTKDGIATRSGTERPLFARGATDLHIDMTFDANGVLSGTVIPTNFAPAQPATGLIGTEGAVAVSAGSGGFVGFTATNPDGGAIPVLDPCIGGLAACYGTHDFWRSNARNSRNTGFLRVRPASAGVATTDDGLGNLITGDATVLNALVGDFITVAPNYNVTLDDLNDVSVSEDIKSGFGLALAQNSDFSINSYYVGLLSGTNVGAPFTDANQPAAEWTGKVWLYGGEFNDFRDVAITLAVSFDDANGGTIGHAEDTYTYFHTERTENAFEFRRLSINGKFDANGVIYGGVTYKYTAVGAEPLDNTATLSGLIGVNGAVAVFGNLSGGDNASYVGGFVARPTPSP